MTEPAPIGYSAGELAKIIGHPVRRVRHAIDKGGFKPLATVAGVRIFRPEDVNVIRLWCDRLAQSR